VSKLLPAVLNMMDSVAGAVHLNQMDFPPPVPAWTGSPGSDVAPTVLPACVPVFPVITVAFLKLSFAGWAQLAVATNPIQAATIHLSKLALFNILPEQ
jgi:hypothetical protein